MMAVFAVSSVFGSDGVSAILERGVGLVGTPYRTGGADPAGFDCSGFVYYLYRNAVRMIPRSSGMLSQVGAPVPLDGIEPGDLLFFETVGDGAGISHVGV